MKQIVVLIVLFAVCTTFLLTTDVLVAQGFMDFARQLDAQHQAAQQQKAIIVGVCAGGAVMLILLAIWAMMREQTKKQNEQQEKRDEEMKRLLDQKLRENHSSDVPDK